MTYQTTLSIGKHARALAAALALGAVILSLSAAPASAAKPKYDPNDPAMMCVITRADGTIEYFPQGAQVKVGKNLLVCNGPNWIIFRTDTAAPGTVGNGGGGVLAP